MRGKCFASPVAEPRAWTTEATEVSEDQRKCGGHRNLLHPQVAVTEEVGRDGTTETGVRSIWFHWAKIQSYSPLQDGHSFGRQAF